MTRVLIAFVVLAQLASGLASGQRRASSITGRVTGDSGHPIANVVVYVRKSGSSTGPISPVVTDEEGRFHADNLPPGAYSVSTNLAGFVVTAYSPQRNSYRTGDTVNIQMTKGGVITGTVTTQQVEPVIAARVSAILVRDTRGRPVRTGGGQSAWTDDRGVYRIYGLQTGSYLVAVNGAQFWYPGYAYEGEVPVYHPSSTRDAAKEVSVQFGQEVSSIDIRYRSEQGHAISGTFRGSTEPGRPEAVLMNVASASIQARSFNPYDENAKSFSFYGVPDGDYQLIGQSAGGGEGGGSASAPRRVSVKGANVTGVELVLAPLGSVAGRLTLETIKEADRGSDCKEKKGALVEETMAVIKRDQKADKDLFAAVLYSANEGALNEKGDFAINRLAAGRYYLEARLPTEEWFIRSITLPGTTRERPPLDIAKDGVTLTAGQRLTGLAVVAMEGAAALRGKVVPASEGGSLPANLRVHVIPAERESAEDAVRFAETLVNNDGTFSLTNLAPGRYYIMARVVGEDEWMDRTPRPLAWDSAARARLRQEMETANAIVDLRQCQTLADYVLKYAISSGPKPPRSKRTGQN